MKPLVIVVRDPDASNTFDVFGGDVEIIDVDLGYRDLTDPDEWAEWIEGLPDRARAIAHPDGREHYCGLIDDLAGRWEHPPIEWGDLDPEVTS